MTARKQMHLVAYLMAGLSATYPSSWRHLAAAPHDFLQPKRWESLARTMEEALFDACFFADSLGITDLYKGNFDDYLGRGGQLGLLDPMTLLPIMSRVTKHLGLGITLSTSLMRAYAIARYISSLDTLSGGRFACDVVTTWRDFETHKPAYLSMGRQAP